MLDLVPFAGSGWEVADEHLLARSSARSCNDSFQSRDRELLLPPPSAVISSSDACGERSWPITLHHRRMLLIANCTVS